MYKIVSYLHNCVEIRITGVRPHKFINICLRRQIAIWNLTRVSDKEFTLCMLADDFRKNVRSAAKKSSVKVQILKKSGIVYDLRRYRKRKIFAVLLILLAVLFWFMTSIVWNVQIEGANPYLRLKTEHFIEDIGIKRGSLLSNINTRALAEQILRSQENLSWVGVKKRGMTIEIQLEAGTYYEEKGDDIANDEACDIVISKDCLLYKVTVEEGTAQIKTGETALKGQIAVSGDGKHAKAEILGCVWYKAEVQVKTEAEILQYTGNTQKVKSLLIFGMKIDLPGVNILPWNRKKEFEMYDRVYSEKYIGDNENIPFGIAELIKEETKFQTVTLSEEEAEIKAKTEAESALDGVIPDEGKILKTSGYFTEKNGEKYYVMMAEVLENVGVYIRT